MKNKKKLTAAVLASSILATSFSVGAAGTAAVNGFDLVGEPAILAQAPVDIQQSDWVTETAIWYNGEVISFTDGIVPKNINGRVMLPFRNVLEMMGAEVEYDEEANTATAIRGDKKIFIDLADSAIYMENGGERQKVETDVPFMLENDHVLIPVRFVADAMGVAVGWEAFYYASFGSEDVSLPLHQGMVCLFDFDGYMAELEQDAPNIYRLLTMEQKQAEQYQTAEKGSIVFSYDSNREEWKENGSVTIQYEGSFRYINNKTQTQMVVDVEQSGFETVLQQLSAEKIDINQLKDLTFDVISDGTTLYFKTNLLSLLTKVLPENETVQQAAAVANEGIWYKIELMDILKSLIGPTGAAQMQALLTGISTGETITGEAALRQTMIGQFDALAEISSYSAALMIEAMFESLRQMEPCISFEGDDQNYTVTMNMDREYLEKIAEMSITLMMSEQMKESYQQSEEYQQEVDEIKNALAPFIYEITVKNTVEEGMTKESTIQMKLGYNDKEQNHEEGYFDILFQMNADSSVDTQSPVEEIVLPESSVDIMFLIELFTQGNPQEA